LFSGKKIFIASLDWGMGHHTRSAALARMLEKDNRIVFGVTDKSKDFFLKLFPAAQFFLLPSYNISLSAFFPAWVPLLFQWPFIKRTIRNENVLMQQIADEHNIDLIISDSRYGLHSKIIPSILITHQTKIHFPLFSFLANGVHRSLIGNFSEVWIPDYLEKEKRLSGELSNSKMIARPVKYIGPLSLWKKNDIQDDVATDVLVILSGAEPQRSVLESMLKDELSFSGIKIVFAGSSKKGSTDSSVEFLPFVDSETLSLMASKARIIICRSGYSTLMDLHTIGFRGLLILIPTPGQSEQEYLANYWQTNFGAVTFRQKELKKGKLEKLIRTHLHPAP
jgi:uncharacterized protein (TIGR00661 family)